MTGMRISPDLISMDDPDLSIPRALGAFINALDPSAFVGLELFSAGMRHYLTQLRNSPQRDDVRVTAPGDREWDEATRRHVDGIPVNPATSEAFADIAAQSGVALWQSASYMLRFLQHHDRIFAVSSTGRTSYPHALEVFGPV